MGVESRQIPDIWHSPSFLSPNLSSGSLCLTTSRSTSANQLSLCALSISSWSSPNGEGNCGAWTSSQRPLGPPGLPYEGMEAASGTLSLCQRRRGSPQHSTRSTMAVMGSPIREPQTMLDIFSRSAGDCRKEAQSQLPPGVGSHALSAG